ncbi:MAG TPA: hypothetical protein VNT25_00155 [Allosphingosinicella sp.]|nr:hypothetical protein [Allosphingosinicella sp.]
MIWNAGLKSKSKAPVLGVAVPVLFWVVLLKTGLAIGAFVAAASRYAVAG